jgi:hypothetical protein
MNKKVNYLITDQNITVNYEGQTHIVPRKDGLANQLIDAIKNNKLDEIPNLVSTAKRIEALSHGEFTVSNGDIYVNGLIAPAALGNKIVKFSNEGLPFKPLVKFASKIQKNPSFRAVNELFQFLEKNDHPITEEGNFIAYKRVRENFTDIHSGTFDNSVGNLVEMPRNQVNENPNETCSHGLHVANWDYAHTQFASHNPSTDVMLEVEVDPADVVAVPTDYNQSKMRVCRYKVLGVVDKEHSSDVAVRYTNPSYSHQDYNSCDECEVCEELNSLCECEEDNDEDQYPFDEELNV